MVRSDPWRTETRHGGGDLGYRQETGAYRSPDASYRRREDRRRGRGLEGLFSGREGDLNAGGVEESDAADTSQESEHGDAAENGADGRKEDVSKQRDVPAEATEADLAQASMAAETSAVEADGTSGARNPPRNVEERGSGRRSSSSRSPDLRQQCDAGCGDGVRSPDHRRTCDGGRGDGVRSPDPRRTRDGGRGDGVRSPDPRRTRDEGSGDGVRSPDPRRTRDGGRGDGVRSPDPRRTRDGGRGDGMRSTAGEADIAHRIGGRAGMGGAVVGLDRLAGIGSTMEDVPDREGGSNMAIEKKAVGWCTAWSEPRKQGRAYSGQKEGEHQGDRWEGRARHGEKEGEARPWA
ncbi:unnamed protein product [Closterium sp. NIES-65]|nr:unnamed protein product [Closterium sp. NIES-65]